MLRHRFVKAIATFSFVLSLSISAQAQAPKGFADVSNTTSLQSSLAATAKNTQTIASDFSQMKHMKMMNDKVSSKGKFYFKKEDKIRIATRAVPFARGFLNPWGDFGRIFIIDFQTKDKTAMVSKYFKICNQTHQPMEMSEEDFKTACVQTIIVQGQLPTLVEL